MLSRRTSFPGFPVSVENLLNDFWGGLPQPASLAEETVATVPSVDLWETEGAFHAEFEVPGFNQEEIEVTVEKNVLEVRGESTRETESEGEHFHRKERRFGSFARRVALPVDLPGVIDESAIEAKLENGVLSIRLPKTPEEQPRKIEVRVGTNG